jgi:hypothetical protein
MLFRRVIGALMLDSGVFEEIEADRQADVQSMLVVLAVCAASGVAAGGWGAAGVAGFLTGAIVTLGGWLVWVTAIATVGTARLAEPQTRSDMHELLRVLGYAAAPGIFLAFAAFRPVAPIIVAGVAVWMVTAATVGVRQALDFRSTSRAIAVCGIAWILSFGTVLIVLLIQSRPVS